MGVEEEEPLDALLAGGELDRAAVVVGLGRLVDRFADLVALVDSGPSRRDHGLDAELAVEHGQAGPERPSSSGRSFSS